MYYDDYSHYVYSYDDYSCDEQSYGYNDYEIRKHNQANIFLCYIRNINRKKVSKYADVLCYDFNQVKEFIKKNYI